MRGAYQTSQRFCRTIGDCAGQLKARWNSTRFDSSPITRYRAIGCGSPFEGYFIEPGLHHNGKLVLGESIGDLAGARVAYLAF